MILHSYQIWPCGFLWQVTWQWKWQVQMLWEPSWGSTTFSLWHKAHHVLRWESSINMDPKVKRMRDGARLTSTNMEHERNISFYSYKELKFEGHLLLQPNQGKENWYTFRHKNYVSFDSNLELYASWENGQSHLSESSISVTWVHSFGKVQRPSWRSGVLNR